MALEFLLTKKFHPSTKENQRKLWIAEEKEKDRISREKQAKEDFKREREKWVDKEVLTAGQKKFQDKQSLNFMYMAPPGLAQALEREKKEKASQDAEALKPDAPEDLSREGDLRKKFDFLKNAPVEGKYVENIEHRFRPLGHEVRNVRCLRCGNWGHQTGDRECPMKDFNPLDSTRQRMEDPLSRFRQQGMAVGQNLFLKEERPMGVTRQMLERGLLSDPNQEMLPMAGSDGLDHSSSSLPQSGDSLGIQWVEAGGAHMKEQEEGVHKRGSRSKKTKRSGSAAMFLGGQLPEEDEKLLEGLSEEEMRMLLRRLKEMKKDQEAKGVDKSKKRKDKHKHKRREKRRDKEERKRKHKDQEKEEKDRHRRRHSRQDRREERERSSSPCRKRSRVEASHQEREEK